MSEVRDNIKRKPKFGDIYFCNLQADGSVQGETRPVIIIQNDIGNKFSEVTNVIALTSLCNKKKSLPTHVPISPSKINGLKSDSVAMVEQIRPIPIDRLSDNPIGTIEEKYWNPIRRAAMVQFPFLRYN